MTVSWRCWCGHDECDWARSGEEATRETAENVSSVLMAGHGIDEENHETFREVGTDGEEAIDE